MATTLEALPTDRNYPLRLPNRTPSPILRVPQPILQAQHIAEERHPSTATMKLLSVSTGATCSG
jgi:hypothetical protein